MNTKDIEVRLESGQEKDLFKWFLFCILQGRNVKKTHVLKAIEGFSKSGITSIDSLSDAEWDDVARVLKTSRVMVHDLGLVTRLIDMAHEIKERYESLSGLVERSSTTHKLTDNLNVLRSMRPQEIKRFKDGLTPVFYGEHQAVDYPGASQVALTLKKAGYEAYIVGGAVRDILLKRDPKDFDVATNATPEQIAEIKKFKRSTFKDTAQAYGVSRVVVNVDGKDEQVEVATFRRDQKAHLGRKATQVKYAKRLEDDIMRRDFTINALALDVTTKQIIDLIDGVKDVEAKLVRFIGEPKQRINEDPLRILRAVRFKNQLGFDYEPATLKAIKNAVKDGYVKKIAIDRVRDELTLMLTHDTRRFAFEDLDRLGILSIVIPELTAGHGVQQQPEYHKEGDVWTHQMLSIDSLSYHPSARLAWATLLHDIGKPVVVAKKSGKLTFHKHYKVGAEMSSVILNRLNFAKKMRQEVAWMIHNHLAIDELPKMRQGRRLNMLKHPAFEDLLELHRADAAASWRDTSRIGLKPRFEKIEKLWHEYRRSLPEQQNPSLKRDLGIDGQWLKNHFGELPGPHIGRVLKNLQDYFEDTGDKLRTKYKKMARDIINKLK